MVQNIRILETHWLLMHDTLCLLSFLKTRVLACIQLIVYVHYLSVVRCLIEGDIITS